MSTQLNVYEAKTQLSRLLERVESGEEVVIARAGRPVARLVPETTQPARRTPGGWEGRVWMAPDFDDTPDEVIAAFEGSESDDFLSDAARQAPDDSDSGAGDGTARGAVT